MTPVILLSDGYIANGAEPWRLPDIEDLPRFEARFAHLDRGGREYHALLARREDPGAPLGEARARRGSSTASAASRRHD